MKNENCLMFFLFFFVARWNYSSFFSVVDCAEEHGVHWVTAVVSVTIKILCDVPNRVFIQFRLQYQVFTKMNLIKELTGIETA